MLHDIRPVALPEARSGLLEAPRPAGDGEWLFADVLAGGVHRLAADDAITEFVARRRGIGGMVPGADGSWIVSGRGLARVQPGGDPVDLWQPPGDVAFVNDIDTTPSGAVLAGVLRFRPFGGEPPVPGEVWSVARGAQPRVLARDVLWPNGIGVAPDGTRAYVSDYHRGVVFEVDLETTDGEPRPFATMPRGRCDGLAVDAAGDVWVALGDAGAVAHLAPDGTLLDVTEVGGGAFVSSLAFDGHDVLITGIGRLWRAHAEVAGLAVTPARL